MIFHTSKDKDMGTAVCIIGAEYAWMSNYCRKFFAKFIMDSALDSKELAQKLFPKQNFVGFPGEVGLAFDPIILFDERITIGDRGDSLLSIALNTVMVAGSDVVKLMARFVGQAEIWPFIEAKDLPWFCGLIQKGLDQKIFRRGFGWEGVIERLSSCDSPVVLSYSVTSQFPQPLHAGLEYDDDGEETPEIEAWYNLPYEERFLTCLQRLKQEKEWLQISPETHADYYFGQGVTGFEILEWWWGRQEKDSPSVIR